MAIKNILKNREIIDENEDYKKKDYERFERAKLMIK